MQNLQTNPRTFGQASQLLGVQRITKLTVWIASQVLSHRSRHFSDKKKRGDKYNTAFHLLLKEHLKQGTFADGLK